MRKDNGEDHGVRVVINGSDCSGTIKQKSI